ncbi:MAG: HepT-like ribonuclease domain-containing protein [Planctomycetota bacterium]
MSSHKKDDLVYLGHMLDMSRKAVAILRGRDRRAYDADETLRLALAHLIQVIGEAARRVSAECRAMHPTIPWPDIVGMRHKIVHDYMDVDSDILWSVVSNDLPALIRDLEANVSRDP